MSEIQTWPPEFKVRLMLPGSHLLLSRVSARPELAAILNLVIFWGSGNGIVIDRNG